jgi:hypothetical protein
MGTDTAGVPGGRIPLRPSDLDRSLRFYRDVLDLAVYREFGPAAIPGLSSPGQELPGASVITDKLRDALGLSFT